MPYNNLPKSQWGKMDRCVTRVQARGKDKKRAIAICYSSIVGKESDMSSSRKKRHFKEEKDEQEAEERGAMLGLTGTMSAEVQQEQVTEPVEEEEEVELTDEEKKIGAEVMEEIDEEDEDIEESEEDDDDEEKEVRIKAEEVGIFKTLINLVRAAISKPSPKPETILKVEDGKEFSPFTIYKDRKGDYRYLAIVSNNFLDRDGDILSDSAHKEFMQYLDENPDKAPELWIWHTPGTAHKERADFWCYENGFVMYSGKLTEEEAMRAEKAVSFTSLGMSHGMNIYPAYYVLERDPQTKVINKYRTFEISYLPLERASNPWTAWSVIKKEVDKMDQAKKKFLNETLGAEITDALIADTDKAKQVLEALGVENKEVTPQPQPAETPAVEDIVKAIADQFGMAALSDTIKALKESVDELKADKLEKDKVLAELTKTDDQKIAEQIQATPEQQYFWLKSHAQSDETLLDPEKNPKDKELLDSTPKPSWITEVFAGQKEA